MQCLEVDHLVQKTMVLNRDIPSYKYFITYKINNWFSSDCPSNSTRKSFLGFHTCKPVFRI